MRRIACRSGLLAACLAAACAGSPEPAASAEELLAIPLPAEHERGERVFDARCAACHGPAATGTPQGPPLVHRVYRPGHHADAAFRLAITRGVAAHHWNYDDMPPVPGLADAEVEEVIAYVRWLQRQAGIR